MVLNSQLKDRLAGRTKKQNLMVFCVQKSHLVKKEIHRPKIKGQKTKLHAPVTESRSSNFILRQNKLQTKTYQKKPKKAITCDLREQFTRQ